VIDFVPYLRIGDNMLVKKGNPLHLTGLNDLCGHRLAAAVGTIYEKQAQQLAADCLKNGKSALSILSPPTTAVSQLALKEGRVDATVVSVPTALAMIKESPDAFETAGAIFDNDTILGIGIGKNKPALKAAMDGAMKAMVADGTYVKLIKKYGLPQSSSLY
jgi:polar amino acid transport system substrate-binding protein